MYHLVLSLERENTMNLQSQITSNTCDSFFFFLFFGTDYYWKKERIRPSLQTKESVH
jgi:hypothetical protein